MNPTEIQLSLDETTTAYAVFETDQVLTADQLNTLSYYADDQDRLTRIKLLGAGNICGLHVSLSDDVVTVTKGVGITSDADVLYLPVDTRYDRFNIYDGSNPLYRWENNGVTNTPFNQKEVIVYELIREKSKETGTVLSEFKHGSLDNMVGVLFMESYRTNEDLCSGSDCDNLGDELVNNIRLLLVDKKTAAAQLSEDIRTPDQAATELHELTAERPLIDSSITSSTKLFDIYRQACASIYKDLTAELPNLYANCSFFLGDLFSADPAPGWLKKLSEFNSSFKKDGLGIQYYYDFLKDVVETWNDFRELLVGDTTVCCPDPKAFPKHLLLGNLIAGSDPDENRTGLYPSPLTSRTVEQLNHAKFLAQKLDTLIEAFEVPSLKGPVAEIVRITPSRGEDESLEDRAIPYYYEINKANPIQKGWNFALHEQGKDAWNYSYNATSYNAQGGAAAPLTSQIGRFSLFRVEGLLAQKAEAVLEYIQEQITAYNLPFAARRVLLGTSQEQNPPTAFSEMLKYPGLEHFAGCRWGGTFVLVQGSDGTVIADFMLPNYLPDLTTLG